MRINLVKIILMQPDVPAYYRFVWFDGFGTYLYMTVTGKN